MMDRFLQIVPKSGTYLRKGGVPPLLAKLSSHITMRSSNYLLEANLLKNRRLQQIGDQPVSRTLLLRNKRRFTQIIPHTIVMLSTGQARTYAEVTRTNHFCLSLRVTTECRTIPSPFSGD